MRKGRRRRSRVLAGVLALGALALTAGLLWRWVLSAPPGAPPAAPAGHGSEEFNAAERQQLENILRQKRSGAQR